MRGLIRSLMVSLWFMFLTLPIIAIRVDVSVSPVVIQWRLMNVLYIGIGSFFLAFIWRGMLARKGHITPEEADMVWIFNLLKNSRIKNCIIGILSLLVGFAPMLYTLAESSKPELPSFLCAAVGMIFASINALGKLTKFEEQLAEIGKNIANPGIGRNLSLAFAFLVFALLPSLGSNYQVNVVSSAMLSVILGLGLNIVVGQAGLLVLGYIAFYAVGAYSYGILSSNYGLGFWAVLPLGGILAALFGLALGFPVLRLKGDYLAIVTLGFGEIVRLVLENWAALSNGAKGIDKIPRPGFFGVTMDMQQGTNYIYYLTMLMVIVTIFAILRLRDSRLGRSWMALREDEIACEAMGIDKTKAKLTAFALGACWAGFGGVLFAAKNAYISPASFTFLESVTILSVVVLGGLGSVLGVILGAFIIVLLPESLRAFSEYRMLIFGACMVLMMVFRPQGFLAPERKRWHIEDNDLEDNPAGLQNTSGVRNE